MMSLLSKILIKYIINNSSVRPNLNMSKLCNLIKFHFFKISVSSIVILMSTQNYKTQLLATGIIDQDIHYGPYAINWWYFSNTKNSQNKQICFPIHINMRVRFELNKKAFIYCSSNL